MNPSSFSHRDSKPLSKRTDKFLLIALFMVILSAFSIATIFRQKSQNFSKFWSYQTKENHGIVMSQKKKVWVLHPFLFALFPTLLLISDHIALISITPPIMGIAVGMLSITSLAFVLSKAIVKNAQKAGIIISSALVLFASYGHTFDFISKQFKHFRVNHRHFLLGWGVMQFGIIQIFNRQIASFELLTDFLNVASISLVMLSLGHIVLNKISFTFRKLNQPNKVKNSHRENSNSLKSHNLSFHPTITPDQLPPARDIYYLIIDGHANSRTLRDIYGYDNQGFTDYLKEKGFLSQIKVVAIMQ